MHIAELRTDLSDGIVTATVSGEIDLSNAHALRRELQRAIPKDARALVLDLRHVEYLDSAGIHLVHRLREDLRARRQKLELAIPADSPLHDTLRLAGVHWAEASQPAGDSAE